jgi:hypothetical protein
MTSRGDGVMPPRDHAVISPLRDTVIECSGDLLTP